MSYSITKGIVIFLVAISTCANAQDHVSYLPENENIQYEGRINFSVPSMPTFAFPGISIKAKFIGTAVKINLKGWGGTDANYFNVFIDGEFVKIITLGEETINEVCQSGLTDSIHTVEVTKRTESFLGKVAFLGFDIDGVLLPPTPKPERKIQFIGNSITCGYGNEDITSNGFVADKENNYLAYGAVCARELNAQYQVIAYSGRGVTYNWSCTEADLVPAIYEKYYADEDISLENQVNHNDFVPDVVVINLGTNDHSCDQLTDDNFKDSYMQFITTLRSYYSDVKILCLTGPMNSTDIFKARLEDIVAASGGAEERIYYFHQTPIIGQEYAGGHWHPNTLMGNINGKEVAAFIEDNNLFDKTSSTLHTVVDIQRSISPNPVESGKSINIDLTDVITGDQLELSILNVEGKVVLRKLVNASKVITVPSNKMKGNYFIQMKSDEQVYGGRIVVY